MDKVNQNYRQADVVNPRWVRSRDGYIAGVCEGLGKNYGIEPGILRAIFVAGIFVSFGFSILVYLLLALSLPKQDYVTEALQAKVLGVCSALSTRFGYEVGLVRFLTVMLAISSFGLTAIAYIALYFALPTLTRGNNYTLRR